MQTFLPYASFIETSRCLDVKRLNKQRIEALQIYKILTGQQISKAWTHHPAVLMWRGYENALALYYNSILTEWIQRGYKNTMQFIPLSSTSIIFPPWLGNTDFHKSHQSNLCRKKPDFYSQYNWNVPSNLPYIWPISKT